MSPEGSFHTLVQAFHVSVWLIFALTQNLRDIYRRQACSPQNTILGYRLLQHVQRTLESRSLVLQSDLDQFKGSNDKALCPTCTASRQDSEKLGVFTCAISSEYTRPVTVRADWTMSAGGTMRQPRALLILPNSHLRARLGASIIIGGIRPLYNRAVLYEGEKSQLQCAPWPVAGARHQLAHPWVATMCLKVCTIPIPPLPASSCCRVLTTSRG